MTITSATMIFFLISKKRGNMLVLFQLIIQGFFVYFINRLLYSMCVNSLM